MFLTGRFSRTPLLVFLNLEIVDLARAVDGGSAAESYFPRGIGRIGHGDGTQSRGVRRVSQVEGYRRTVDLKVEGVSGSGYP